MNLAVYLLLATLCTAVAFSILNRARGGGDGVGLGFIDDWRGRPIYYVAPLLGVIAGAWSASWLFGLIIGLGYLVWGLPAWGKVFDLGHMPELDRPGEPMTDWVTSFLPRQSFWADWFGFAVRQLYVAPMFIALWWLMGLPAVAALVLVVAFMMAVPTLYAIAWRLDPERPIFVAELATGGFWGGLVSGLYPMVLM